MDIGFSIAVYLKLYSYTNLGIFSIILLYLKPFELLCNVSFVFNCSIFYTISVAQQRICNASQNTKKENKSAVYTEINNNKKKIVIYH